MTNNFVGVIIEESLEKKDVLKKVKILKTKIEKVTEKHKTPWIKQWTLHTVEILENQADSVAKDLSKEQYDKAKIYGISLGIPEYQVDFHPDIKEWKR